MHGAVLLEMVKSQINKTYLSHIIDEIEGKSEGSNTLVEGARLNKIKSITNSSPENWIDREVPNVRITPIAKLHFQNKLSWFSEKKKYEKQRECRLSKRPDVLTGFVLSAFYGYTTQSQNFALV